MLTLRLDPQLEKSVTRAAKSLRVSKSELVRRSLVKFLHEAESRPKTAWEAGHDLIGKYAVGDGSFAADRKRLVREKVRRKLAASRKS